MVNKISYKMILLILFVCVLCLTFSITMLWTVLQAYFNHGTVVVAITHVLGNLEVFGDIAIFSAAMFLSVTLIVTVFRLMASHVAFKQVYPNKDRQLTKPAVEAKIY